MNLGNCPECGKLYVKTAVGMCLDCYKLEEENEKIVAEYVRDHPRSSVEAIHKATGVKEKTIFRMIKNGRFMDISEISYPCESCGSPIYEGRLCDKCNANFLNQVKESESARFTKAKEEEERRRGGMYTKNMVR
ncbi:hypothetical protein [Anaerosinus massiliensis]|uniref:hypothetical protein n=1 Tax=Massilibacillus massiliensis TaxID=1806837 RepID=UPI0018FEAC10|nr:hypothetical protein [Massilibacillus massiliensis]